MTAPEYDGELIHKLAAMTDSEFDAVVKRARGVSPDTRNTLASKIAAAEAAGDYSTAIRLKTAQLYRNQ